MARKYHGRGASYTGACSSGKRSYASKSGAKAAIKRRKQTGYERAYRCRACAAFHTTSMRYHDQIRNGLIDGDR